MTSEKINDTQLTPKEAATILNLLRQARPSVLMSVDNPDQSLKEALGLQALLVKLKRLAGEMAMLSETTGGVVSGD
jgi:hypothetical protein